MVAESRPHRRYQHDDELAAVAGAVNFRARQLCDRRADRSASFQAHMDD